jgi:protein-S-isoprenylcysteine O-methyltransferase Ste14
MKSFIERVNAVYNDEKIRKKLLKLRLPLALVGFVLLLPLLKARFFFPGLIVSVVGALIQMWCFATIHTKRKLTTTGPYMFVRNPMYIGRFFIILGIILMTGSVTLMAVYVVAYYFYMVNRVKREEAQLEQIFAQDYLEYKRDVRAYLPTRNKRFAPEQMFVFDREAFERNSGWVYLLVMVLSYVILYLFAYVW